MKVKSVEKMKCMSFDPIHTLPPILRNCSNCKGMKWNNERQEYVCPMVRENEDN